MLDSLLEQFYYKDIQKSYFILIHKLILTNIY